jgi:hypothetical protein
MDNELGASTDGLVISRLASLTAEMNLERTTLNYFCDKYGLSSPEALKASHAFDDLHMEYISLESKSGSFAAKTTGA